MGGEEKLGKKWGEIRYKEWDFVVSESERFLNFRAIDVIR